MLYAFSEDILLLKSPLSASINLGLLGTELNKNLGLG